MPSASLGRPRARAGGDWVVALLLVALTMTAYLPALRGGFVWDDDSTLTDNPLIKAADGLHRIWFTTEPKDYWPVTYSALWLEWRLWGPNPMGYHAVSLMLHVFVAGLLALVLRRAWPSLPAVATWGAAFLFALHPVNAESVAWITQQKTLWAALWLLISAAFFLAANRGQENSVGRPEGSTRRARACYIGSLSSFALAMLSKGSVAMFPFALLGLLAGRGIPPARSGRRLAPFFAIAVGLTAVNVWFQQHDAAHEAIRPAGLVERGLEAGAVMWFYISKAVWPAGLAFVYPQWSIRPESVRGWISLLAAGAVTAMLWRRRNSPRWRAVGWGWAYYGLMLVPVMGLVDVYFMRYSLVADHYQYLAIMAWAALAGVGVAALGASFTAGPGRNWARWPCSGAVIALALLTYRQCEAYGDIQTLYAATLRVNPHAWLIHYNLGERLLEEGRLPEATAHFRSAVRVKPDYMEAHNDLGIALAQAGRLADAADEFATAVRLGPGYAPARVNLGNALAGLGRSDQALAQFEAAVRLQPGYAEAYRGWARALHALGRDQEAQARMREAERADAHR